MFRPAKLLKVQSIQFMPVESYINESFDGLHVPKDSNHAHVFGGQMVNNNNLRRKQ